MNSVDRALRRGVDLVASLAVLAVLAPLLAVIALSVKATARGPVLFVQERVGRGGRTFRLLKFRTMVPEAPRLGPPLTVDGDPRVTRLGRVLRRHKLDELPQLWNVVRGDMSLVGPRPEVPRLAAHWGELAPRLLAVRPGLTDPASLAFRDEAEVLAAHPDPERAYRELVLPAKLELSVRYLDRRTVLSDLAVLVRTVWSLAMPRRRGGAAVGPARDHAGRDAPAPVGRDEAQPVVAGDGLGRQAASGVTWSAVAYYADALLRLGISVGLARLLAPSEFGTLALAMSVIGVFALLQESGLSAALIQMREKIDAAATSALVLMLSAGAVLAVAFWLASGLVAGWLGRSELAPVLAVLSVLFVVQGAAHVPRALLQRSLAFRPLALGRVASTAVYGALAVALAAGGLGVWALVVANIAAELVWTGALWVSCGWRPRWSAFDRGVAREISAFGAHLLGASVLALVLDKLPVVVIGRMVGIEAVGLYWMSQRWASLPIEGVTYVVSRVTYPLFARLRDERERFARAYLRALEGILLLAMPASVGLALVAAPLVATLYDESWTGAAGLLRILAFWGLFHSVAASTGEVFKASGAPRLVLVYAAVYALVLGGLLAGLGRTAGLEGIAIATVLAPLVVAVLALRSACRMLGLGAASVLRLAVVPGAATALMALVVVAVDGWAVEAELAPWVRLVVETAVGAAAYVAIVGKLEPDSVTAVLGARRAAAASRGAAPRGEVA